MPRFIIKFMFLIVKKSQILFHKIVLTKKEKFVTA